jgi:hypothetical protein
VKKLALRPSSAGVLVHHRDRPDRTISEGCWPALVSRADWERVTTLLGAPGRQVNGSVRPGARKHLLTWGIGACGVCGGLLRVGTKGNQRWGTKQALYLCADRGCVGRNQAAVDDLVRSIVVERLRRPDAFDWLLGDDEAARLAAARVADLRKRLDDAADSYAEGTITKAQLERITANVKPQIARAEVEHRRHLVTLDVESLRDIAGPKAAVRWDEMAVSQRRALLGALGITVRIDRVSRRGPGFDPESVRIAWKGL